MAFSDPFDTPRREASNLTVSTKKRVGEQRNQTRTRNCEQQASLACGYWDPLAVAPLSEGRRSQQTGIPLALISRPAASLFRIGFAAAELFGTAVQGSGGPALRLAI